MYGITAKTQKARGVQFLSLVQPSHGMAIPDYRLAQTAEQVRIAFLAMNPAQIPGRLFARPCPITPRHGFVDSQVVNKVEDAERVFSEAVGADPQAEMLLMKAIQADQSAVLTPTLLSVGAGHDGVTGEGRGVVTLPLSRLDTSWVANDIIKDTPYMESVSRDGAHYLVQLRDGPATDGLGDANGYIPADVVVTKVLNATGDLLEWETKVKNAPDGTAVWLPGGSMLSHYAVHAVLRGLPVLFKNQPNIGQKLVANVSAARVNYEQVARGVSHGISCKVHSEEYGDMMRAAVFASHHVTAMERGEDGQLAIGLAVGFMLRGATAALLGEMRHKIVAMPMERDTVYHGAVNAYGKARSSLREAWHVFYNGSWTNGFGGKKWAGIAMAAIALDGAALAFVKRPGVREYRTMVASLHTLLNAIHNNGPWIGKFTNDSGDILNKHANGHVWAILASGYAIRRFIIDARGASIAAWGKRALKSPRPDVPVTYSIQPLGFGKVILSAARKGGKVVEEKVKVSRDDFDIITRIARSCGGGGCGYAIGPVEIDQLPRAAKRKLTSLSERV